MKKPFGTSADQRFMFLCFKNNVLTFNLGYVDDEGIILLVFDLTLLPRFGNEKDQ